ncbi:MAG: hypothetical protein WAN10_15295 [Candidatus Acidiferrales bacterium]
MKTTKPMLEYLATCSKISLESFELARLNDRANLRKEMVELLDELIEVDIQARIAEWVLTHRRLQAAMQPATPHRVRRNGSVPSVNLSLPLLPMNDDSDTPDFPALGANRVMRVLRDTADDSLASLRRGAAPVLEKAKRIA